MKLLCPSPERMARNFHCVALLVLMIMTLMLLHQTGLEVCFCNHPRVVLQIEQSDQKPMRRFFNNQQLRTTDEILRSRWVVRLKEMLNVLGTGRHQVSVVFGDYSYLENVLNWLIAATVKLQPPLDLKNVIVFCLDEEIFSAFNKRGIHCILLDPQTVVLSSTAKPDATHIWITRMVVYRLINMFGFDVVGYDSDAILLRNPQDLLDRHQDSDIISSAGKFPRDLAKAWGFTVCMGVVFFRSTPRTEVLWESMNSDVCNDQVLLNTALNNCHIYWQTENKSIELDPISGKCFNGLTVTILSHNSVCRRCTELEEDPDQVYMWHQHLKSHNGSTKSALAKKQLMWFLKDNWTNISDCGTRHTEFELLRLLST